ncbi:MAG: flagellar hook-length control protein FliK [Candidatus Sericytochromatia bacterium]|nr:flagellar hook-length control protein FliK [Candidatus Sericytochromatia bacterium]
MSAAQVIQAVNQNIPIHVANFPAFVNQVIQTQGARLNVVQSIDVTLQPAHLGQVTAQFQLTKQNQVVVSLYTQSLATAKTLESYVQEIQQIVGKTQFSLSAVTIKQAVAPARSAGGSGQTSTGQQQGEFSARQSGSRRGGQRRRRQGEDLSIDGVSV